MKSHKSFPSVAQAIKKRHTAVGQGFDSQDFERYGEVVTESWEGLSENLDSVTMAAVPHDASIDLPFHKRDADERDATLAELEDAITDLDDTVSAYENALDSMQATHTWLAMAEDARDRRENKRLIAQNAKATKMRAALRASASKAGR